MYVPVIIRRSPQGYLAEAPALPGCGATGASVHAALLNVRLRIEGHVAECLGTGRAVPEPGSLDALRSSAGDDGEWFEVHINLDHVRAVARHQAGRW